MRKPVKYELSYVDFDVIDVAVVEIDHDIAEHFIKEFVEFWMNWQDTLKKNGGDYTKVFLKSLTVFILREHRKPDFRDEGWPFYCNECGIKIISWEEMEFDEDSVVIETA